MRKRVLILVYIIFFSCSDNIYQKEKDLLKYDYLFPFIIKDGEYVKGVLNVDTNELTYYYKVKDIKYTLNNIETEASLNGWKNNNIYQKKICIYSDSFEIVSVYIIEEKELIKIVVK